MGLLDHAYSVAEKASGSNVASAAAITAVTFPYNIIISGTGFVLTLVYLWGAMPRFWRTCVAFKRGIVDRDWSLWKKLGNQPQIEKED
jgi:hypothetical protein